MNLILVWLSTWLRQFVPWISAVGKGKVYNQNNHFSPPGKGEVGAGFRAKPSSLIAHSLRHAEKGGRLCYFANSPNMKDINNTICGELITHWILDYLLYMFLSNLIFTTTPQANSIPVKKQTQRGRGVIL